MKRFYLFFKMHFREVTELEPGTKYKIIYINVLRYTGTYQYTENGIHTFSNVNGYGLRNQNFAEEINKFYVPIFQKEHIQSAMEERALTLILRNITGDHQFIW